MGWLSSLAKIGGAIAAPFTGGASLALSALGTAGDIASRVGAARAQGRAAEAAGNLDRDQVEIQNRRLGLDADRANLGQAMRLALLGGAEDASVNVPEHIRPHVGSIRGGLRPSAFQGRSEIIEAMKPRILEALMRGGDVEMTPTPQPNWIDKLAGGIGTAGLVAGFPGAVRDDVERRRALTPTTAVPDYVTPISPNVGRKGIQRGLRY